MAQGEVAAKRQKGRLRQNDKREGGRDQREVTTQEGGLCKKTERVVLTRGVVVTKGVSRQKRGEVTTQGEIATKGQKEEVVT